MRIHLKEKLFSFLLVFPTRHYFGIWVSSVSQIMCLHSPTKKRQVSFRSLKNYHVLAFWRLSSALIMVAGLSLSADAYMANREWGFLMPMSPCANREDWRETAFPLVLFLITTIVGWRPAFRTSFPHNPANVWGCHISLSQYIYIYIIPYIRGISVSAFHQTELDTRSKTRRSDYSGD